MTRVRRGCGRAGRAALAFALLATAFAAQVQTAFPSAPIAAAPLATRLVAEFSEREQALAHALASGDRAAALALVDPQFELVALAGLGQSTSFDELFAEASRQRERVPNLREMAVRDFGATTLVSFYLDERQASNSRRITWAVLDAWTSASGAWKLKTRYIGIRGNPKLTPPGFGAQVPLLPKRY